MKTIKETIPEIIAELEQEQALERNQILEYRKRISEAWRREKDATRSRVYRLNKKSRTLNTVTNSVTESVTESVTPYKEERSEKENLPPTPPIREKGKKEETLTYVSVPRFRAHAHTRGLVPSLEEMLSASSSMKVPEWYIRYWHSEMVARDWTAKDGSVISNFNWRVNLCSWYKNASPKEIAAAKELERSCAPVCRPSNPKDWVLCIERCAYAANGYCQRGITTPPQLQSRPHPPEECRLFAGKEVAR